MKINDHEFNAAIISIKTKLNPNPTFEFKDLDNNYYIEPEITIIKEDNKFNVHIREVEIFRKITIKDYNKDISIKLLIKNIVEKNKGISDSKISDILKSKGISIAR